MDFSEYASSNERALKKTEGNNNNKYLYKNFRDATKILSLYVSMERYLVFLIVLW